MSTETIPAEGILVSVNNVMMLKLPELSKQSLKLRKWTALTTTNLSDFMVLVDDKSDKVLENLLHNRNLPSSLRKKVIARLK